MLIMTLLKGQCGFRIKQMSVVDLFVRSMLCQSSLELLITFSKQFPIVLIANSNVYVLQKIFFSNKFNLFWPITLLLIVSFMLIVIVPQYILHDRLYKHDFK
jgi:hypothetical protein